ncbi:VanZ family protein [Bacillus sp. ISL-45]|uniref:VanZ family protein n=1 Tax=Bacillus sp. ISL-45 TaxID=2819128 RepID=UPI001BEBE98A|nr:VanZ family protein [Bacillus sp. ISL-45]MBT2661658.1 VanZ family protein [Bacillus sp. ISL-45]
MNKLLAWGAVLLWCVLIFSLSAQPAAVSNELSKGVTEAMIEHAEKVVPDGELNIGRLNHIVRKNAHFFLYLILGILVLNALRQSGKKGKGAYALALLISVLYSMTDEFHQLYVAGRGAHVRDVLIDSAGVVVGLGGYFIICWVWNRRE